MNEQHLTYGNVGSFWFALTTRLLTSSWEGFRQDKELKTHAIRSLKTIALFRAAPAGKRREGCKLSPQSANLKNWGVKVKEENGLIIY